MAQLPFGGTPSSLCAEFAAMSAGFLERFRTPR
jgi:hypothetical protein